MKNIYSIALMFLIFINSKIFSQLTQPWSNSYLLSFSGGGHLHDITNNYRFSSLLTSSKRSAFFSRINYPVDINANSFMTMSKFKETFFSIVFESVNYGNFEKRSINNELQGKFSANDLNLTVGLAKKIKKTNYSYGLNTSLFSSNINNLRYKSILFSPSISYENELHKLGFAVLNYPITINYYNSNQQEIDSSYLISFLRKLKKYPISLEIDYQFLPRSRLSLVQLSLQIKYYENVYLNFGVSSDKLEHNYFDDALLKIASNIGFGVIYNTNYGNFNLSLYSYGYEIIFGLGVSVAF
tara:strand:- start:92 stop:985 length:894 start_codon:yes stop_codon:yes gene_type:complete